MPVTTEATTEEKLEIGSPPPPVWPEGGGDDESWQSEPAFPVTKGRLGLWLLLGGIVMLFGGFSSAYIVLRGLPSWQNVAIPSVLWISTGVLLASSVTIEMTRKAMLKGLHGPAKAWIGITGILGLAFLGGQVVAWMQMVQAGVYLPSTLHSSFLYILTGTHGIHLIGGLGALLFVLTQTFRNRYTATDHEPISLCATYWHFMDGLWVYLFLMFLLA
jgi:cytochrome c oxidase subunit 3